MSLLNEQEGAGHQVLSAFVEIVFDNSDNRIPVIFWTSNFLSWPFTGDVILLHCYY